MDVARPKGQNMVRLGIHETKGVSTIALEHEGNAYDVKAAAAAGTQKGARRDIAHARTLEGLLNLGEPAFKWIRTHVEEITDAKFKIAKPRWRAPLSRPQKICAIGLNYLDHCKEQGLEAPKSPILFAKYTSAIVGPGDTISWEPALTQHVDWEAELAVVIGRTARRVPADKAFDHVAGYMVANDVTARNLQKGDGQFTRGKSLDTFCPLGPWFVTKDSVPDPHALSVKLWVNDTLKQDTNTGQMIFRIPQLVEFLSNAFTLFPGDVILTGTGPGVGMHRKPPEFLQNGDRVAVEIEGLGRLENPCRTEKLATIAQQA
jgi:2-keto-4-pentenoate hydratase/2-oxohepta-3-ene-1,7-dioic acid hydratase in catechol pathway